MPFLCFFSQCILALIALPFAFSASHSPVSAAAANNGAVVAFREQIAAIVPFRRRQPEAPPAQNVNSAPYSRSPARQFGGCFAQIAMSFADYFQSLTSRLCSPLQMSDY